MRVKIILHRLKQIFWEPKKMWAEVAAEDWSVGEVYKKWIIGFASVSTVRSVVTPWTAMGTIVKALHGVDLWTALLLSAVTTLIMHLLFVVSIAFVIHKLSVVFGGKRDLAQATKTIGYAITPIWLAGLLAIPTVLAIVKNGIHWYADAGVSGIWLAGTIVAYGYFVYMMVQALPVTMQCEKHKRIPYTLAIIFASLALQTLFGLARIGVNHFST